MPIPVPRVCYEAICEDAYFAPACYVDVVPLFTISDKTALWQP